MQCDLDACDLSGFDIVFGSDITGLVIYQCANWTLGGSHGGAKGTTRIFDGKNTIFQRVSVSDNQNGAINYYKTFWHNVGDNWENVRVEVTTNSSSQFSRESVAIAVGTSSDNMTDKPNDSTFGTLTPVFDEVATGSDIPIWIRQTITAGGATAERGQDIQVQIMLVSAE